MPDKIIIFGLTFVRIGKHYHCVKPYPTDVADITLRATPFSGSEDKILIRRLRIKTKCGIFVSFQCYNHVQFKWNNKAQAYVPVASNSLTQSTFQIRETTAAAQPQGIWLNIGPFGIRTRKSTVHVDDDGSGIPDFWFNVNTTRPLLSNPELPISINANESSKMRVFFNKKTNQMEFQWKDCPLKASTLLGKKPNATEKQWEIDRYVVNVNDLDKQLNFPFNESASTAKMPLLLHPFYHAADKTNSALASVGLDTKALHIEASRAVSGDDAFRIDSITAIRDQSGVLRTYGLVEQKGHLGYQTWNVPRKIPLAVRPWQQEHPGGLLLKEPSNMDCHVVEPMGDTSLLGFRGNIKMNIAETDACICFGSQISLPDTVDQINPSIAALDTTPYFKAHLTALKINRPAVAMFQGDEPTPSAEIESWSFKPSANLETVAFPLFPDECITQNNALKELLDTCNESFKSLQSPNKDVTHESRFKQRALGPTKQISPTLLFKNERTAPNALTTGLSGSSSRYGPHNTPGMGAHIGQYDFGSYIVTHDWVEGEPPEYVILDTENLETKISTGSEEYERLTIFGFSMAKNSPDDQNAKVSEVNKENGLPTNTDRHIVAVLKLGQFKSLEDILLGEGASQEEWNELKDELPKSFLLPSWTGLILFGQKLDLSQFELLESIVPKGIGLKYLAVSPNIDDGSFATYGLVSWKNEPTTLNHPALREKEVGARMLKLDITWAGRELTRFYSETLVSFKSFAGSGTNDSVHNKVYSEVTVIGGYDKEKQKITFMAQAEKPVKLLSDDGIGPIKQVWVSRIEIGRENDKTIFDIDGDIELAPFNGGNDMQPKDWNLKNPDLFSFKGLSFGFDFLDEKGTWCEFDYPSIDFKLGKGWNLFDFDNCKIEFKRIAFDKSGADFNWNDLIEIGKKGLPELPQLRIGININLGELPLLCASAFEELNIDIEWSIPFNSADEYFNLNISDSRFGLRALGFEKLNIQLMRFLEIQADSVIFESKPNAIGTLSLLSFLVENLKVKVLQKTVIDKLTFAHYWLKGTNANGQNVQKKGFVGVTEQGFEAGILDIHWALIGRNIVLPTDFAKKLVSLIPLENGRTISSELVKLHKVDKKLYPQTDESIGEWIFAAGFGILDDFLIGKFLFQDNAYYGLAIEGPIIKKIFGYKFAISVLYIKKENPEEDLFRLEIAVPSVDLGGVSFNGGVIAIEIQMNGGFLLDMGYPWLSPEGERQWERGFGVMISGLMGRGGCFIAKRSSVRKTEIGDGDNKKVITLFEGGQATMVGIGGSFNAGPLRVTAYAGIYYAAEGALLFQTSRGFKDLKLVGLRLSGAIGIQARGIAELDWWIISVRVEVVAGAEARLTLFWGALENFQPGTPDLPAIPEELGPIGVRVDFILYARVSARACIGKSIFKVCKGISVGISMPYRTTLYLQ